MFQGSFPTTRATMRRFIALLLLLVTVAFQAEAVFGEVRDGSVHHEAVAEAWIHAHDPHGSHPHDGPQAEASIAKQRAGDEPRFTVLLRQLVEE